MKRRSKMEIYLDLLEAVSKTSKPTRIGNQANLSWKKTQKHLEFLERNGYVRVAKRTKSGRLEYELTKKGFETLHALQKVAEALSPRM